MSHRKKEGLVYTQHYLCHPSYLSFSRMNTVAREQWRQPPRKPLSRKQEKGQDIWWASALQKECCNFYCYQLYFINSRFHTNLEVIVLYTQHMHHFTLVTSQPRHLTIMVPYHFSIGLKGVWLLTVECKTNSSAGKVNSCQFRKWKLITCKSYEMT